MLMEKLNVRQEQIIYVGNSERDEIQARASQFRFVGATWHTNHEGYFAEKGVKTVSNTRELIAIMEEAGFSSSEKGMTNKQKNFVSEVFNTISKMPSNHTGYTWHDYPVSMEIRADGSVITKVDGKEFHDACPTRGSRRDRNALSRLVCGHICETWGGTLDDVLEFLQNFLEDFAGIMGNIPK